MKDAPPTSGTQAAGRPGPEGSMVPSNFSVTIVDSIRSISQTEWDQLATQSSFYLSHHWLASVEEDTQSAASYLLLSAGTEGVVAALPIYRSIGEGSVAYNPYLQFGTSLLPAVERIAWFPTLLGGSSAGYVNEFLVNYRATLRRQQILQMLAGEFQDRFHLDARSAAFMYLRDSAMRELPGGLTEAGHVFLAAGETWLQTPWQSFGGYLSDLPHSRRYSVRRELEQFRTSGCSVSIVQLADCYDRVGPLLANVQHQHGHQETATDMVHYLERQARWLNDQSLVFLCFKSGRLIGFSLGYQWQDALYLRAVGLDYEFARQTSVYFNIAFYLPIRHAIECGLSGIHLGSGSYEAKVLRGARLEPLWSLVVPPEQEAKRFGLAAAEWNESRYTIWNARYERLVGTLPSEKWRIG
jgi:predicted N-acyltransferase